MSEGVSLVRLNDGVIVYANPRFEEMFGYSPDEMVGKHVSIVNAPTEKTPEQTITEIMGSLDKHRSWRGELNNIKKDGTLFWCYASVTVFDHPEHGRVAVSVHTDITERKQAEKKNEESRHFLEAVIEAIPDATMVVAADYRVVLANRAARDLVGVEDPVAADLRCHQVFHHRDVPCDGVEHPCPLVEVVAAKGPVVMTHTHCDAEGNEVLMEIAAAPILNEAGGLVQIVQSCRDISNRVKE